MSKPRMDWQPIHTAPPDGREILVWVMRTDGRALGATIVQRDIDDDYWLENGTPLKPYVATHWMPLPDSPPDV